jgi:hypothetical protein
MFGSKFPAIPEPGIVVANTTKSRANDPLLMGSPRVWFWCVSSPNDARPHPKGVGTRDRISRGGRLSGDGEEAASASFRMPPTDPSETGRPRRLAISVDRRAAGG